MLVYFSPPKADFVKYADGGYAMITGGAGGIGKSFADQFGKLGINLYLVDFNESLLKATKKELESKYPNILVKKGFTLDDDRFNIIEREDPLNSHLDIFMFYHRKWNSFKSKTIDLTELTDEKKYDAFRKEIQAMKIGILFNCAGNG